MGVISIVFGIINQLVIGGHHLVEWPLIQLLLVAGFGDDLAGGSGRSGGWQNHGGKAADIRREFSGISWDLMG